MFNNKQIIFAHMTCKSMATKGCGEVCKGEAVG